MNARRPLLVLALLLATAPAFAVKPFVADYSASWKGVSANARISLAQTSGNRWNYELSINNSLGSARQVTLFDEAGGLLRPLSGVDTTQLLFKKMEKSATYDWATHEARWSGDVKADRVGPVKLQAGDIDGMLLNLAIVRDVEAGKPLNYRMVDNGVARPQTYQNLGKDTVTIDGQARNATKVSRTGDDGKQIIVWVVDGIPTPARILQRKDGKDELELTLKSVH